MQCFCALLLLSWNHSGHFVDWCDSNWLHWTGNIKSSLEHWPHLSAQNDKMRIQTLQVHNIVTKHGRVDSSMRDWYKQGVPYTLRCLQGLHWLSQISALDLSCWNPTTWKDDQNWTCSRHFSLHHTQVTFRCFENNHETLSQRMRWNLT